MTAKGWASVGTAAALLAAGIAMLIWTEERDIGTMLVLAALASAGVPAVRDSLPRKPPGAALLLLACLPGIGCGAAGLESQALAAHALRDALEGSREAIEGEAARSMERAGEAALAAGQDPDEAITGARERYEEVALESGEVVIYDRENEDAWIQSNTARPVADVA